MGLVGVYFLCIGLIVAAAFAQPVWNASEVALWDGSSDTQLPWSVHLYNTLKNSIVVITYTNTAKVNGVACWPQTLTCGARQELFSVQVFGVYQAFTGAIEPLTDRMFLGFSINISSPTQFLLARCNATTLVCAATVTLTFANGTFVNRPVILVDTVSAQVLWVYYNQSTVAGAGGGIYVISASFSFTSASDVAVGVISSMADVVADQMTIGAALLPLERPTLVVLVRNATGPAVYSCGVPSLFTGVCSPEPLGRLIGRPSDQNFVAMPLLTVSLERSRVVISFVDVSGSQGGRPLFAAVCNVSVSVCVSRLLAGSPTIVMPSAENGAAQHAIALDEAADAAYVMFVDTNNVPYALFCSGDLSSCSGPWSMPRFGGGVFTVMRAFFVNGQLFASSIRDNFNTGPTLWAQPPTPPVRLAIGTPAPESNVAAGSTLIVPLVAYTALRVPVVATGFNFTVLVETSTPGLETMNAMNASMGPIDRLPIEFTFRANTRADVFSTYTFIASSATLGSFNVTMSVTTLAGALVGFNVTHEPAETPSSGVLGSDVVVNVQQRWRARPVDAFNNLVTLPVTPVARLVRTVVDADDTIVCNVTFVVREGYDIDATPTASGQFSLQIFVDGSQKHVLVVNVLLDCLPGSFVPVRTDSQCISCVNGTYAERANAVACTPCPASTSSPQGALSAANCTCVAGTWAPSAAAPSECAACPSGASCSGGGGTPSALPGFYPVGNGLFERCTRPDACLGGGLCARGYEGFLCNRCAKNYYSEGAGRKCARCPAAPAGLLAVAFAVCLAIAALGYAGVMLRRRSFDATPLDVRHPRAIIPFALPSLFLFAQVLAMLDLERFSWPSSVRQVLSGVSVFGLSTDLLPTQCSVASQTTKYLVHVLLPFLVVLLVAAIVFGVDGLRRLWPHTLFFSALPHIPASTAFEQTLLSLAMLLYVPIARLSLSLFSCVQLADGRWYLAVDPGERCFVPAWNAIAPVGVVAVVVYVLGIPGAVAFVLVRHRAELYTNRVVLGRYGALFQRFWSSFWWFELAVLARRLAIVLVAAFALASPVVLTGLLLAVFALMAGVTLRWQPAYLAVHNQLESQLNTALSIVLLFGFAFSTGALATRTSRAFGIVCTLATIFAGGLAIVRAAVLELRRRPSDSHVEDTMRSAFARYKEDAHAPALERLGTEIAAAAAASGGKGDSPAEVEMHALAM